MKTEDPRSKPPTTITRPQRGPPNDDVPHEETNHTPALAGCLNPRPHQANTREWQRTRQTKPTRVQTPNMTTKPRTEYKPHDRGTNQGPHPLQWDLNRDPQNKTPAQVMTSPPVQNQVHDQGAKGVPHTRFGGGVVLVQTWDDTKTGTNHTPAIAGVWFYTRFSPEPPPNETPPPLEMTMHPPMESPKCNPPNKTQKRRCTTQDFHLSLPPALTPKSKTHDPAEDSRENGRPQTPKMTPSWYKTVPHTHFSGIQIETPEMTTYPNGEVPSHTPDHTCPSSKNKTELPN
ncbi:hypothetical protein BS47DRAFT_1369138 [Hydnum rufescens UP504]|uniref:Uncharacterized protein n=1 Tax=Hydnum rufescens UP504 TaxID=1448309 RepID=A0A9P6ADR8_9AGAM|nr:hypothetical protein BS47DRAFT_1369138 [Hydnum rufescens UP504]